MKKNFTIKIGRFGFNIQFKRKFRTQFKMSLWANNKESWKRLKGMVKRKRSQQKFNEQLTELNRKRIERGY